MDIKAIYHATIRSGRPARRSGRRRDRRYRALSARRSCGEMFIKSGVPDVTRPGARDRQRADATACHHTALPRAFHAGGPHRGDGHSGRLCQGAIVIVVDDAIDVSNLEELIWAMLRAPTLRPRSTIIHNAWRQPIDRASSPSARPRANFYPTVARSCRLPAVALVVTSSRSQRTRTEAARLARQRFGYLLK